MSSLTNYFLSMSTRRSYFVLFSSIVRHISKKAKVGISWIFLTILLTALVDIVVLPVTLVFLSYLTGDQNKLRGNPLFSLFDALPSENAHIYISILFISVISLSSLFKVIFLRLNFYNSARVGNELGSLCFHKMLCLDFEEQKLINSSSSLNLLVVNVNATTSAINNLLLLSTSGLSVLAITFGMFYIDFNLTLLLIAFIISIYYAVVSFSKRKLGYIGETLQMTGKEQNKIIQESRGGLRDIVLSNAISYVSQKYSANDKKSKMAGAQSLFLSSYPRQVLELSGFSLIGVLALVNFGEENLIATLGTFVFAIQRLLPNVQSIYMTWAGLRARKPALEEVVDYLRKDTRQQILPKGSIAFESLEFRNVYYSYPGTKNKVVLKDINFKIYRGDKIGIVGPSGAGKSTLLDLLMLLITPKSGHILINGETVVTTSSSNLRSKWMNSIGHVPQEIFLIDDSIANNISLDFTKSSSDISSQLTAIQDAAKFSEIHSLIAGLPMQYNSPVGERGSFLSGGQKQRLGIARAIYKSKGFLVFDEATSALDSKTEDAIIHNLSFSSNPYTLIMVAHRLESLRNCNRYFCIDQGSLTELSSLDHYA